MLVAPGATGDAAVPPTTRGPPGSNDSNPRPNAFRLSGAVVLSVSTAFSAAVVIVRTYVSFGVAPASHRHYLCNTSTTINLIYRLPSMYQALLSISAGGSPAPSSDRISSTGAGPASSAGCSDWISSTMASTGASAGCLTRISSTGASVDEA